MEERLQKVLARAGIASRRRAEELIAAGRVSVDGKIVKELGTRVDPRRARVEVDGRRLVAEQLVYIALHKPRAVMCTMRDPEGRPTVADYVREVPVRVYPVGRLDFHTSGILLLTNDGEFSSALQHPSKKASKIYVTKVTGEVSDEDLLRWRESIVIDGRQTQPADVRRLRFAEGKTWLEITLREGRNRQVRRLGEATGFPVMRLARQSFAGVTVEGLRPGEWRPLSVDELKDLKQAYGVPRRVRAADVPVPARRPRGIKPPAKASQNRARVAPAHDARSRGGAAGGRSETRYGEGRFERAERGAGSDEAGSRRPNYRARDAAPGREKSADGPRGNFRKRDAGDAPRGARTGKGAGGSRGGFRERDGGDAPRVGKGAPRGNFKDRDAGDAPRGWRGGKGAGAPRGNFKEREDAPRGARGGKGAGASRGNFKEREDAPRAVRGGKGTGAPRGNFKERDGGRSAGAPRGNFKERDGGAAPRGMRGGKGDGPPRGKFRPRDGGDAPSRSFSREPADKFSRPPRAQGQRSSNGRDDAPSRPAGARSRARAEQPAQRGSDRRSGAPRFTGNTRGDGTSGRGDARPPASRPRGDEARGSRRDSAASRPGRSRG
jgi:23S rRNA pseudouridine2605 synthase